MFFFFFFFFIYTIYVKNSISNLIIGEFIFAYIGYDYWIEVK